MQLDSIDRKLLGLLQDDADLPLARLADAVGLTATSCWRRVQRLRQSGVIRRRVALLDASRVNVGVTVFVSLRTRDHSPASFARLKAHIEQIPEIVEFYRMSGDVDYLLRVVVPDIAAYDAVYKRLIADGGLADVSSSFAMEQIKYTTALPLLYAA